MLKELKQLTLIISFRVPPCNSIPEVHSFSDAVIIISSSQSYCQTDLVSGILFGQCSANGSPVSHAIYWSSSKQRHVCHSNSAAEIFAFTGSDDCGFHLKEALAALFYKYPSRHEIHADSKGFNDKVTLLHEGSHFCLRETVQRIQVWFEVGVFDGLWWVQGSSTIADALTKRNTQLQRFLCCTFASYMF